VPKEHCRIGQIPANGYKSLPFEAQLLEPLVEDRVPNPLPYKSRSAYRISQPSRGGILAVAATQMIPSPKSF
jgi:hypothetical protein